MCAQTTAPAEAYIPDANRAGPAALAHQPDWFVHCLARLIVFLLQHLLVARQGRSRRLQTWSDDRPDLPAGSTQAEAASIRGPFGRSIAWMCRRHGIGPGHKDWPELSRAIVAFGGSVAGARPGMPALGLLWWENPNVMPGFISGFGTPKAATASLPEFQGVANASPPAPKPTQPVTAQASLPASWLVASVRQVFAPCGPRS